MPPNIEEKAETCCSLSSNLSHDYHDNLSLVLLLLLSEKEARQICEASVPL